MTREEAIADIKHAVNWAKENGERWCDSVEIGSLELAIEALDQPEQKKGKWEQYWGKYLKCSSCDNITAFATPYCPWCGAEKEKD